MSNLYIPHGSDERLLRARKQARKGALYIPHGSDESAYLPLLTNVIRAFISHMVQMKVMTKIHSLTINTSLYPTWFR